MEKLGGDQILGYRSGSIHKSGGSPVKGPEDLSEAVKTEEMLPSGISWKLSHPSANIGC